MDNFNFGPLPFVYVPLKSPSNEPLPDYLPFSLKIDPETGLIVQVPNNHIDSVLHQAYSASSQISGMMDNQGIGKQYAEDFLSYIKRQTGKSDFKNLRVLDIGCGTGYLLHLLKQLGADVSGLEPGEHGQSGGAQYGVQITRDFFPSPKIKGKFDIITAFGLLEHIHNYDSFFHALLKQLADEGALIFAVPDCSPYLESGDISFLFHEHWSYFTTSSLTKTLERFTNLRSEIHPSSFGGTIYSTTYNGQRNDDEIFFDTSKPHQIFEKFIKNSLAVNNKIESLFLDAEKQNKTIGVFAPLRIINVLAWLKISFKSGAIRFFDDNTHLHNTFYPGINIRVESRNDLQKKPTDILIIMSHTFGEAIARSLRDKNLPSQIITWNNLFSHNA